MEFMYAGTKCIKEIERKIFMFEELVRQKEQELISKNLKELRDNINEKDYEEKILNYCEKYNFDMNFIKQQILTNDVVASFFSKDPTKQNFTEKLIAKLLNTKTLPQQGKNCIRFNKEGEIDCLRSPETTKSADFCINQTYITQKYTRGKGGAQDNQYKDVVDFLEKGSKKYEIQKQN